MEVTFTHEGTRYGTDADTYRIFFEVVGTGEEVLVLIWGLKNGKIQRVIT